MSAVRLAYPQTGLPWPTKDDCGTWASQNSLASGTNSDDDEDEDDEPDAKRAKLNADAIAAWGSVSESNVTLRKALEAKLSPAEMGKATAMGKLPEAAGALLNQGNDEGGQVRSALDAYTKAMTAATAADAAAAAANCAADAADAEM